MGFISFSVRRYVAVFCLMIAVVGLGLNAYRKLPLEELPRTDVPYITVITIYPGASPGEIETDVAKPVEDALGALDGLKSIRSSCMEDVCHSFLEFNIGTDVDASANDVREQLDLIINDFPEEVQRPRVLKFDINAQPVVNLAISGTLPIAELFDYADNDFRDQMSTVNGVAEITLTGGSKREVQVLLDRNKLAARGLNSLDIVTTLRQEMKMIPVGRIRQQGIEHSVKFDAEVSEIAHIEQLEILSHDGQRCYIRDVGRVVMGSEEVRQGALINGKPAIAVRIIKKADANAVEVVREVEREIELLRAEAPGGVELIWVSDEGNYIRATVISAVRNIWQGILLTALLLFFFLYDIKSTLIVALSMPVTVIAGIWLMSLLDYTLNTATLLALGLSIGILITNSIVVLESIAATRKKDADGNKAAITGAERVLSAVLASAATNIVVLFPVSMMKGQIGQFFIPFALTMVCVTAVSLFASFTLTPALCGRILSGSDKKTGVIARMQSWWDSGFNKFTSLVVSGVNFLIKRRRNSYICVGIALIVFLHALWLVPQIGFSFLPITDRGEVMVKLEFPTSFALGNTTEAVAQVSERLADLPELKHLLTTIGKIDGSIGQNSEGVYLAQILCVFTDKTERSQNIYELRDMVNERLSGLPDVLSTISLPDQTGTGAEIKLVIRGNDFEVLDGIVENLVHQTSNVDWLQDIDSSVRPGKNELRITPRRAILSDAKVKAAHLGAALRTSIEGLQAASFKRDGRTYDVKVKMEEKQGVAQIAEMQMPALPGFPVVLQNFVHIEPLLSPVLISRHDRMRSNSYFANPTPDIPLNRAADQLMEIVKKEELLPGYSAEFIGKIQVMNEGIADFVEVGAIALILTYLVLASILNSFTQPFIILLTIPLGLIGCIWMLALAGEPISMMILLGCVMLIGIVVNNAILIMDKVNLHRASGSSPATAMKQAVTEELRAISMITLAAVFGMLPMALDSGLGSELRSGIGIAAVGGILVSSIFTMIILPVFYCLTNPEPENIK